MKKTTIDLAREIQAISQSGLAFTKDCFDKERFEQLQKIAASIISRHTGHPADYMEHIFSAEAGYATPKLDVRGAVFQAGRLLLVKERQSNGWTLPGGFVDVNESLSTSVEREVKEESGFDVKASKVIGIFDHRKHGYKPHLYHFYKIYMMCDLVGGSLQNSVETIDGKFFTKDEIDHLELDQGRTALKHVQRAFDHLENATHPTDFD